MSGTGDQVPYHLRVNKYIERQVFAEALAHIDRAFTLADYAYISMGGVYLEDFRMVHREFGIQRLYSFDAEEGTISRQQVNSPFGFIRCECATSGEIIARFDNVLADLVASNAIVWLDYTTPKKRRNQLIELGDLVKKLGVGDVLKITLNADPRSLGDQKDHAALVAKETLSRREKRPLPFTSGYNPEAPQTTVPAFHEWQLDKLRANLAEFCPTELPPARDATAPAGMARILAEAVRIAAVGAIEPRKATHRLEPIYAIRYSDGQQMLTVTAVVIDHSDETFLARTRLNTWPMRSEAWGAVRAVQVPYLSVRERYRIHTTMHETPEKSHTGLGFMLDEDEPTSIDRLRQYRDHYLRYPSFVSADL